MSIQMLLLLEPLHGLWKAADPPLTLQSTLKVYRRRFIDMPDRKLHLFLIAMADWTEVVGPFVVPN